MSYFKTESNRTIGEFQHKETKCLFEFRPTTNEHAIIRGFDYEIAVGQLEETRYAIILKTVAYIAIDEDDYGMFITEKWPIKTTWSNQQ